MTPYLHLKGFNPNDYRKNYFLYWVLNPKKYRSIFFYPASSKINRPAVIPIQEKNGPATN